MAHCSQEMIMIRKHHLMFPLSEQKAANQKDDFSSIGFYPLIMISNCIQS